MDTRAVRGHSHECDHCSDFWQRVRDGTAGAEGQVAERDAECPACGRRLLVVSAGGVLRCVECGIAELASEGHVAELWWSEDPRAGALSTGWGGSPIWACSCGARDEDERDPPMGRTWAESHAGLTGGRVLPA
jgi:hypothetical protein